MVADRIVDLNVFIDGKSTPIPSKVYSETQHIDSHKKPVIIERAGFPEVILWEENNTSIEEVHLRFQNYSFSERRVMKGHKTESTFYAMSPPPPQILPAPPHSTEIPAVALGPESVKTIREDRQQ